MKISIKGLDKATLLARLVNFATPKGNGLFVANADQRMSVKDATLLIAERREACLQRSPSLTPAALDRYVLSFDYVWGRPIKLDLSGDDIDPYLYDRDAGDMAAATVVDKIRVRGEIGL